MTPDVCVDLLVKQGSGSCFRFLLQISETSRNRNGPEAGPEPSGGTMRHHPESCWDDSVFLLHPEHQQLQTSAGRPRNWFTVPAD